ncbi:MAG: DUF1552 domain-containing protein [Myxococcales bacterium]|nr:DUF1552 domain-containing protein [Myxococcales bacterium]
MRRRATVSRRNFLRGAGGIAVALPFLESIGPARAGGSTAPLRYLQFMHVQGTLWDEWAPSGPAGAMVLSEILSPLEPVRDRIVPVVGCDNPAANDYGVNGHVNSGRTLFTCAPNSGNNDLADGPSIDQVIADRLDAPTPYKTLQFGIGGAGVGEYQALMAGSQDPVPLDGNPQQIFDQLFSDLSEDPSQQPTTIQRLRARRSSVLDAVLGEFNATMARASTVDRQTLERHADKIRELEIQLGNEGEAGVGCAVPTVDLPPGYDPNDQGLDDVSSRAFIDLMVMALACDMSRVGTLQYTNYHGPDYPWLPVDVPGSYPEWHSMVHDLPNMADRSAARAVYRWYMEEYAYLLQQLAATPDGDGSLLDHMLVMSTSELGNPATHSTSNLPIVLAGGVGGQLSTGRYADLGGARTGELFVTFLQWFGATDTVFGNPAYCSGPVAV